MAVGVVVWVVVLQLLLGAASFGKTKHKRRETAHVCVWMCESLHVLFESVSWLLPPPPPLPNFVCESFHFHVECEGPFQPSEDGPPTCVRKDPCVFLFFPLASVLVLLLHC